MKQGTAVWIGNRLRKRGYKVLSYIGDTDDTWRTAEVAIWELQQTATPLTGFDACNLQVRVDRKEYYCKASFRLRRATYIHVKAILPLFLKDWAMLDSFEELAREIASDGSAENIKLARPEEFAFAR